MMNWTRLLRQRCFLSVPNDAQAVGRDREERWEAGKDWVQFGHTQFDILEHINILNIQSEISDKQLKMWTWNSEGKSVLDQTCGSY